MKSNIIPLKELDSTAQVLAKNHNKKMAIVLLLDSDDDKEIIIDIGMYRTDLSMAAPDIREALCFAIQSSYGYDEDPELQGMYSPVLHKK